MKYIYGLSISGKSIIEYFVKNKILFIAWDDNQIIKNEISKKYKNITFIHPKDIDWSKITEAFVSPGIALNIKALNQS